MNPRRRSLFFLALAIGLAQACFLRADLVVERLSFLERVAPIGSLSNTQSYFQEFLPSPNAIAFSQTASIPPSYSTGTYDLSWSGDVAHFQSTIDHHLQGFRGGLSSNGGIRIRPAVDSIVTLSGTWTYNLYPALLGGVFFSISASEVGGAILWREFGSGGNVHLLPSSGTFNFSGSALLQAGVLYSLGYNANTNSHDPPPASATWLGAGFIDIFVNPVPEPVTAAMLALGALMTRRITAADRSRNSSGG